MKKRSGPSPAILGKGAAHRVRTKYYRAALPSWQDDDGDSLTGRVVECNACGEIALPYEGGECRECGTPQYF